MLQVSVLFFSCFKVSGNKCKKKLFIRCFFLVVTHAVYLLFLYFMKSKGKKPAFTEEEVLERLGKRIKDLRQKKGYSSYEYFAYENDISRAQYGRYEKGEDLRFSSLVRVIKALGMTVPEFFAEGFE